MSFRKAPRLFTPTYDVNVASLGSSPELHWLGGLVVNYLNSVNMVFGMWSIPEEMFTLDDILGEAGFQQSK